MSTGDRERFSLRRWSQRKHAAAREEASSQAEAPPGPPAPAGVADAAPPAPPAAAAPAPLPPVDSLRFDDDFAAFMKPEVDPSLRRAALKKLFADPRFNVMDGLDVYIDDYSKPDPIDPSVVAQLVQARYLFDPPKTRVNERGEVEDVPPEDVAAAAPPPAGGDAAPAIADAGTQAVPEPPAAAADPDAPKARGTS